MLGRACFTFFDVMHEFRKSPSRRRTTSCRGDDDDAFRGIVRTGHAAHVTPVQRCHARRAHFAPMVTRLLALLLLAATTLATAEPQASAPLLAAPAADWEALACAALVALYVARRRSHWLAG